MRKSQQFEENKKKFLKDEGKVQKKEKQLLETRLRYETKNQEYKQNLEKKLEEINVRKEKKKLENSMELEKKYNLLTMMREDNYEKTLKFEKIQDYLREKKMERINERMMRIENIQ